MEWVYWAIVAAALIHIAEEYWGGFLIWFPKFSGLRITVAWFAIVNALFVLLCVMAATVDGRQVVFRLSVAALIFINACIHLIGTIRFRRYSPGLVSAIALYIPLAFYAYFRSTAAGRLTLEDVAAFALGALWHAVPFLVYLLNRPVTRGLSR